jgi:1,4-dihydroxy-2-naphthoate octaprenyltransferase
MQSKKNISAIFQHLRFPFSILLLPVFLFSLFEVKSLNALTAFLLFVILHVLVYPSSNAYNSLQDRDTGSIGLIEKPMMVPPSLSIITICMDILAILLAFFISWEVSVGVLVYILFSRLYSYRAIRLKKFPILGFLTVFIFQGCWIFLLVQQSFHQAISNQKLLLGICSSCLIGAVYPLSQIYQHQQDKADGVRSISYLLGYKGTFGFAGFLFLLGAGLFLFIHQREIMVCAIFSFAQFPIIIYFLNWAIKVWQDPKNASYKHTMVMNGIAAVGMNVCFIILNFYKA